MFPVQKVSDTYVHFWDPKMLSECKAVMGCVFNTGVCSLEFAVLSITQCSCCCWLSCCFLRVKVCCLFLCQFVSWRYVPDQYWIIHQEITNDSNKRLNKVFVQEERTTKYRTVQDPYSSCK
jgi:hypothetical protein